jgi:L-amino acid ligase C-terminal domain 2
MPGTELNGLVVVRDGEPTLLTLSDRLRPDGVAFGVGWIHSFPSALPERALASARAVAFAAVRALGLRDGIAFPQLIVDEHGAARIVEIAARIPAGQMADLALFGTGINLFDIAIAQALGRPVTDEMITPRSVRPIAIRFLTASPGVLPAGQVTRIAGLDAVRASPGVLTADLYFGVDDVISPLRVDFDRRGYVVATGDSATTALESADTAAAKLIVRTRDPDHAFEAGMIGIRHLGRLAPVATLFILLVVGLFANDLARHGSVPARLVAAIRLDRRFSPRCDCSHDVAHIAVNLIGHAHVTVRMLDSLGRSVATLTHRAPLAVGWNHLRWTGRDSRGELLHAGTYRPEFVFTGPRQQVVIAGPIELEPNHPTRDTDNPAVSSSSADSAPRLALARSI